MEAWIRGLDRNQVTNLSPTLKLKKNQLDLSLGSLALTKNSNLAVLELLL